MKTNLSLTFVIGFLMFAFSHTTAQAQILNTKSDIINTHGTPFCSGISENGDPYLYYKYPVTTKSSGTFDQRKVLFFKENENGEEICYKWKILEPASETKYNMFSFSRDLVQTDEMQWKDFGKSIIYDMEEKNGVCRITARYDNEVSLVKTYKM
ncbi:hypothetical protein FHG64_06080 [Antarcticibacterium flavum]|uniref:Uncharacterized protein n=1 Tax=Antarcticibacterium flavum TaxID=2058175 RepID=A0A5B7X134_9FLAO|nr:MULTISPECIES: hypothetical protein [Antarcticibacterium]MCM4160968.1 hypothetical protein [Antarcticibacterium sp. W02-3]QCY69009.1 hypothetical protein FHG64_06080 [Antarcticibacterium flavum]